ncbi:hypothetical protein O1D97_11125 [Marinomonas sp. 15G1-11]|uniref:DUF2306 domain-containing protein n=1 Tax=Marinomonas phaeophyticola TaxID=3004091 RepID=A0ABT4JVA0_9GAMM|nr:hypothetical protein [Marinomonas sp. 15G1-11]MCZ2722176.1 hypothetical protein [Marinomonas sp. 15G1-11]
MKDIIVWAIHTPAGTIALVAAVLAMFAKKGSTRHKKAGSWFSVSMMAMLVSGIVAAYLKNSIDEMMLSAIVLYTAFTAWLTVHHKKDETDVLELTALIWVIGFAIFAFFLSMGWQEVETPVVYLAWSVLAVMCALGDIRNLYYAGLSGTQRMIRHVWRIGFTLIWAALAFTDKIVKMMGANVKNMQEEQVLLIVAPPTLLILIMILYWITQILFFSREKFATHDKPIK